MSDYMQSIWKRHFLSKTGEPFQLEFNLHCVSETPITAIEKLLKVKTQTWVGVKIHETQWEMCPPLSGRW